jgi:hypothetical protein
MLCQAQRLTNVLLLSLHACLLDAISNGATYWVLRNASAFRIPGTYDWEDITLIPGRMNIKAGATWLHMTDKT